MRWKIKKDKGKIVGVETEKTAVREEVEYIGKVIGSIYILGKTRKLDQEVVDLLIDVVKEAHLRGMKIGIKIGKGEVE